MSDEHDHHSCHYERRQRQEHACKLPGSEVARRIAVSGGPVIIDTPGFRSETTTKCLAVSDFVLVPVKASPFDVDRMLDTLSMLVNAGNDWHAIYRCVLTQTTRDSV